MSDDTRPEAWKFYERYRKWLIETGQFREEALVSEGDIRIEVAKAVLTSIGGDAGVELEGDSDSYFWYDLQVVRKLRSRIVHGNYDRHVGKAETALFKETYTERVNGGVFQHASVEAESIVGGAYSANYVGPFLRLTAFSDFMAWGGWAEADATRVELSSLAIRSYMGYTHAAGARVMMAYHLFDDWIQRTENFGSLTENHVEVTTTGGPDAVVENHS